MCIRDRCDSLALVVEEVLDAPGLEVAACPDTDKQTDDAEDGDVAHAHAEDGVTKAHDEGQRDGHDDGEEAPRALSKSLHDHEAEHGEQDGCLLYTSRCV